MVAGLVAGLAAVVVTTVVMAVVAVEAIASCSLVAVYCNILDGRLQETLAAWGADMSPPGPIDRPDDTVPN